MSNDTCIVCGHPLSIHFDEGDGYRCHGLGPDLYQCECYLRKNRMHGEVGLEYYSLEKRIEQRKKEMQKGIY